MKYISSSKKKIIIGVTIAVVLLVLMLLCCIPFLLVESMFEEMATEAAEYDKSKDPLTLGRPENAAELPDLSREISDIRMTVVPREYEPPTLFAGNFENISVLQIWYGYCSEGTWYDHPSENYDLLGVYENDTDAWKTASGSHLVKIGPHLLINISIPSDPDIVCTISDTLGSEILEPFEKYNTYDSYVDDTGKEHRFIDTHGFGYGYLCEDPAEINNPEISPYLVQAEFHHRYYVILNYDEIADEYELKITLNREVPGYPDEYTLSGTQIKELVESQ